MLNLREARRYRNERLDPLGREWFDYFMQDRWFLLTEHDVKEIFEKAHAIQWDIIIPVADMDRLLGGELGKMVGERPLYRDRGGRVWPMVPGKSLRRS